MKWKLKYSCDRGIGPATGTLSWLLWSFANEVECWACELMATNVSSPMGRLALGVFGATAGLKAVMCAAS